MSDPYEKFRFEAAKVLEPLIGKPNGRALHLDVGKALKSHLDDFVKWRNQVFSVEDTSTEKDAHDGRLSLQVKFTPRRPARMLHIDFEMFSGPPEPSMIDRIAALEDREAAWRCFEYDRWTEAHGKAAS